MKFRFAQRRSLARLMHRGPWMLGLIAAAMIAAAAPARAATINRVMIETFNTGAISAANASQLTGKGSLTYSGTTVKLNNSDSNRDNNTAGLVQNVAGDVAPETSGGPTTSWIMEATLTSLAASTTQPKLSVILSFAGSYGVRVTDASSLNWALFYYVGGTATNTNITLPAPSSENPLHLGLVFTRGDGKGTLALYANGDLIKEVTDIDLRRNAFEAGFGIETHTAAQYKRGLNGTFDAIAYSTFTGTFDPTAGDAFSLYPSIFIAAPAPAALPGGLALLGLIAGVRRRRIA